jgi:AsmA protein
MRWFKWLVVTLTAAIALPVLLIALFGWNWLRAPIERMVEEKTGRVLTIGGDLEVKLAWPAPRVHAFGLRFANPAWAREKDMLVAEAVELTVDLPQLISRNLVFPEVRLVRPLVFLETGSGGRRNWLLDHSQQDTGAYARIGRLSLDRGVLGYDDSDGNTSLRSDISSTSGSTGGEGTTFSVQGKYRGLALKASGSGGPVLAILDEGKPYPLKIDATVGPTNVKADGTVTGLASLAAVDMMIGLKGGSLDELFFLLGIALPATRDYSTAGRLVHGGNNWRYEKFSGRIGGSDIAGAIDVTTGGKRPALVAELVSQRLDIQDLGPMVGARPGSIRRARSAAAVVAERSPTPMAVQTTGAAGRATHVLPELPFKTDRWNSVDAEVKLTARSIVGAGNWPLDNVVTRLSLRDSVLKLEPLDFGMAGGHLNADIRLDGRADPIQASARVRVRDMRIARLLPDKALNRTSVGRINGEVNLTGHGNSVGRMLATSNGKLRLAMARGEISRLMMEQAGLHLWEILEIRMTSDKLIHVRCGLADFDIAAGVMQANVLVFDTEVTTISGTGNIDLGSEKLDLVLNQKTKNTSPVALRSPILVHGTLASPEVGVDRGRVAARAIGAVALAIINPLLALIPLIDAGPGKDSDCRDIIHGTSGPAHAALK